MLIGKCSRYTTKCFLFYRELEEVMKCLHLISIKDCPFFAGMMDALRYLCGNGFTSKIQIGLNYNYQLCQTVWSVTLFE